jgi:hypothetical protein
MFEHRWIHVKLKKVFKIMKCGMWPWKVLKWPWFGLKWQWNFFGPGNTELLANSCEPPTPLKHLRHRELYFRNRFLRSITLQNILYSKNMIFKKLHCSAHSHAIPSTIERGRERPWGLLLSHCVVKSVVNLRIQGTYYGSDVFNVF